MSREGGEVAPRAVSGDRALGCRSPGFLLLLWEVRVGRGLHMSVR